MSKPSNKTWIRLALYICLSLTVFACGGGGGGGGGGENTDTDQPALGSEFSGNDISDQLVNPNSCVENLDAVLDNNSGRLPNGRLEDLSSQCDYRIDQNIRISGDAIVEAGVTFSLAPGVTVEFNDGDVTLAGTTESPIRFLPEAIGRHWGSVSFSSEKVTIDNTLFSEGGQNFTERAAVEINRSDVDISISNTTISDSFSHGLELGGFESTLSLFEGNTLRGNAGYGLILTNWDLAEGLSELNDFVGVDSPNSEAAVLVENVSAQGTVIRDIGVPYRVNRENPTFGDFSLSSVLVEAGVEIEYSENVILEISDSTLNGTVESPIVLTSLSNQQGSVWGGVRVERGENVVRHVRIENGGGGLSAAQGALEIGGFTNISNQTIENINIVNAQTWGVFCPSSGNSDTTLVNGWVISGAVAGDIHPACMVSVAATTAFEGETFDVSSCAQTYVANTSESNPFVFSNTDAECDYLVSGEAEFDSSVVMEPGVTLVFTRSSSMEISGTLTATGTEDLPITLMAEVASDGYWNGLVIGGVGNLLEHVEIRDGGQAEGQGLRVFDGIFDSRVDSDVSLQHVTVSGSLGNGIVVEQNTVITAFSNNEIFGNSGYGLGLLIDQVSILDTDSIYNSALAQNGLSGINILDNFSGRPGVSNSEGLLTLADLGEPFRLTEFNFSGEESILTLQPGVEILVNEGGSLNISRDATALFQGNENAPVNIGAADPSAGWLGLVVSSSSLDASFLNLSGAGAGTETPFLGSPPAALSIGNSSTVTLENIFVNDSAGWAITCFSTNPSDFDFSNLSYDNNALGNINPDCGS